MKEVTKVEPKMWGDSILGFGLYHYKYESGREGGFFLTGFSPRKQSLTLYFRPGFQKFQNVLRRLVKHKKVKSGLYVNKKEGIDLPTIREWVKLSVERMEGFSF